MCARALAFVFLPVTLECLRPLCQYFNANLPLFCNLIIFLFLGNCNFYDKLIIGVVVAGERIDAVVAEILS